MDHFDYKNGVLHAEAVDLTTLADAVGTPFYCYSDATLRRHIGVFREGLTGLDTTICYAVKANSNLAVLAALASEGAGADVVSEGEIRRALAAEIAAEKIVFSGVGKTRGEMAFALEQGILQFNVESEPELRALDEVARSKNRRAPVALRINPDVDAGTHKKISTGRKENKFGVAMDEALALYQLAAGLPGIRVQGVSMHIGSQLTSLDPFRAAYARARDFVQQLRAQGQAISILDLGGGLGVPYEQAGDAPPLPRDYGAMVREEMSGLDCRLLFEPGRLIVANAGILVSRVLYVKESAGRRFVILDAAMNDLMRPALYDAHHDIVPVRAPQAERELADIVGPVCESGDVFAIQRPVPPLTAGDLVAFRTAGAYGATMASTYNSRLLVPEVMVRGCEWAIVRARPTYEQMLVLDALPVWGHPSSRGA